MTQADVERLGQLKHELIRQAAEYIRDSVADGESKPSRIDHDLDALAVLGRTDATLTDLAIVANEVLCWDSQSFVEFLGIRCRSIRALGLTPRAWEQLRRMNGGRMLEYNLHNWST